MSEWVTVPREPTAEMVHAPEQQRQFSDAPLSYWEVYTAMVSAAPHAPSTATTGLIRENQRLRAAIVAAMRRLERDPPMEDAPPLSAEEADEIASDLSRALVSGGEKSADPAAGG
jgi:hypothetical protein